MGSRARIHSHTLASSRPSLAHFVSLLRFLSLCLFRRSSSSQSFAYYRLVVSARPWSLAGNTHLRAHLQDQYLGFTVVVPMERPIREVLE